MYVGHQNEKYQLVDDLFDINEPVFNDTETKVNPEFIKAIEDVFKKHSWINSDKMNLMGSEYWLENEFSKYWSNGVDNFKATMVIARLFGVARDFMLDNFRKHNKSIPLSARWGRLGIKYCIYKIVDKEYPDFCMNGFDKKWDIFNIEEIKKNIITREGKTKLDMIEAQWADKLDGWFKQHALYDRNNNDATSRIEKSIRQRLKNDLENFNEKFYMAKNFMRY